MSEMKTVYTAASDTEAEIIRNLLAGAGIESEISSDDGGGMLQSLSYTTGVTVTVEEKSFGDAMVILDGYKKGENAITEDNEE